MHAAKVERVRRRTVVHKLDELAGAQLQLGGGEAAREVRAAREWPARAHARRVGLARRRSHAQRGHRRKRLRPRLRDDLVRWIKILRMEPVRE